MSSGVASLRAPGGWFHRPHHVTRLSGHLLGIVSLLIAWLADTIGAIVHSISRLVSPPRSATSSKAILIVDRANVR